MFFSLAHILAWLQGYTYLVLFPISIIEGPIVTVLGGFLAAQHYLSLWVVYAVVVVGNLTGDGLYYLIGFRGGRPFLNRWGRFLGVTPVAVEKMQSHFAAHRGKTIILAKLTQVASGPVLVGSGFFGIPFGEFMWFSFLGELPKTLALLLLGYYFGNAYSRINNYFHEVTVVLLIMCVLVIIVYRVWVWRRSRRALP